jgi:pimeloyl-ACP methyl ester carboxylesterase
MARPPESAPPPLQQAVLAHGALTWREAGQGPPLLLLHGIGSGAASWAGQFEAFAPRHRVIAWDAPGYGSSAPLAVEHPRATDYAQALDALLDHLGVDEAIVLGHSLGAIVAAAWCAGVKRRARGLLLASPARGYASASAEVREAKVRERVQMVEAAGVEGMARERAAALCAPQASAQAVAAVRDNMARVTPGGYAQAAWMLSHEDLMTHLADVPPPLAVLCGELDRTTPPAACERIANDTGAPFVRLQGVAHACYVEDPAQFNRAVAQALHEEMARG